MPKRPVPKFCFTYNQNLSKSTLLWWGQLVISPLWAEEPSFGHLSLSHIHTHIHRQQLSSLTTRLWGFALLPLPLSSLLHNQPLGIPILPHYAAALRCYQTGEWKEVVQLLVLSGLSRRERKSIYSEYTLSYGGRRSVRPGRPVTNYRRSWSIRNTNDQITALVALSVRGYWPLNKALGPRVLIAGPGI